MTDTPSVTVTRSTIASFAPDAGDERTAGFLPIGPFTHLEPTAVASVRLDDGGDVRWLDEAERDRAVDALVLVRLHHEPLALLHLMRAPRALGDRELLDAVEAHLENRIAGHRRRGCAEGARPEECPEALSDSVAVIIPTGGRPAQLRRCLENLRPQLPAGVEVLVVDNRPQSAETRETVEDLAGRWNALRYLAESRPGSSAARNRGIAQTSADLLVFTDDDVVVDEGWLPWLLSPFADAEVTVTTGMVLPYHLATPAQKRFEQYAGFSKGVERGVYDLGANRAQRFLFPYWGGVFGSGNSMAFRREALVAAGGFDTALGAGSPALAGADIEAMTQAILRGGRLVYEPRSICWHEHRREDAALRRQLYNYGVGFGALLLKALVTDPGFSLALLRSLPIAVGKRRERSQGSSAAGLPEELVALQRRGIRAAPRLYARSVRWSRRLGLDAIIRGA
jgi:GT2 family glycosyltransferase